MCRQELLQSADLKQRLRLLKSVVDQELLLIKEMHEITGVVDTLFAAANSTPGRSSFTSHTRCPEAKDNLPTEIFT